MRAWTDARLRYGTLCGLGALLHWTGVKMKMLGTALLKAMTGTFAAVSVITRTFGKHVRKRIDRGTGNGGDVLYVARASHPHSCVHAAKGEAVH